MENGGAFTVNTGRSVPMLKTIREQVPVNAPLVLYNGSAAYDLQKEQFVFTHEIGLDLWETVGKCQQLLPDMTMELQGVKAHYRFAENPMWDAYSEHQNCEHAFAQPGDDVGPFLKFALYGPLRDVTVASTYDATPEEMEQMNHAEQVLKEIFGEVCEVFRPTAKIIDVHAKGVSKARAARQLQQHLGRKILVCAGDAENDLLMLQDADFAFVPADAILADRFPNVCKCADGAVADVIYEKIPEILKKNP